MRWPAKTRACPRVCSTHLGLHKPLLALHQHNERDGCGASVIERLARGERMAYVSDAGTPAISDPGAALVSAVHAAGHRCVPIAGVSSVVAALSVAGDAHWQSGFAFVGFAPTKAAERRSGLDALAARSGESIVLFEAPHRVAALADALAKAMPMRRVTLARELTKQFEEVVTLQASAAPAWLAADVNRARGEYVLVLHAMPAEAALGIEYRSRAHVVTAARRTAAQAGRVAGLERSAARHATRFTNARWRCAARLESGQRRAATKRRPEPALGERSHSERGVVDSRLALLRIVLLAVDVAAGLVLRLRQALASLAPSPCHRPWPCPRPG